jgi:hypothetical protein
MNWDDVVGSMQDTFNADAFGAYRVKNQVLPKNLQQARGARGRLLA